ncbi:glycerate kinase [Corynebacterium pyruviciproducens]|uniref:glycerate kinase n=1 Tax=Corynebacterium pyruviciproducens TaxID=598660 RepID=UPI00254B3F27|nr:glycerate kinase [Corynebacterium pyruviciproducens]MDK7214446.1 glycerate kinase [Corynebacterium pyruviciproducens]
MRNARTVFGSTTVYPMIIVSPDRFPPLSPAEAASAIAAAVGGVSFPLLDARLGTSQHFEGSRITLPTTGVSGRLTEASYTYNEAITTAFIDVAAASGPVDGIDPLDGDSYGTGVLIADALARGATTIVLAAGDSGAHDLGAGILTALGVLLQDEHGSRLSPGARPVEKLASIDLTGLNTQALGPTWIVYAPTVSGVESLTQVQGSVDKLCEMTGVQPTATSGTGGGLPLALTYLTDIAGTGKVVVFNPLTVSEPYQALRNAVESTAGATVLTATPEDNPTQLTRAVRKAAGTGAEVIELTGAGTSRVWTPTALAEWVTTALPQPSTDK